jgi:hypothetical protein
MDPCRKDAAINGWRTGKAQPEAKLLWTWTPFGFLACRAPLAFPPAADEVPSHPQVIVISASERCAGASGTGS